MNSYERVMAASRLQPTDCVPVAPYMGNHGAIVGGARIAEYCTNGLTMAQAQLRAWEIYGQDMLVPQSDNYYIAQGFGVKLHFPENSTPICGDMTPVLSDMADSGADLVEIDHKVSLRTAKQLIGDRVCLIGNLDPSAVLLYGTPDQVAESAQKCIDDASQGGGFILGSGCELAYRTPRENVSTMIRVARNNRY